MAWSPRRITVSTIGNTRGLAELLERTNVHIALSIHSPFAAERERLMPVEKAFPLREIMPLLKAHDFAHQRRLSMEYTMFAGINDDERHADALARILRGTDARVNLIRFHRTPGSRVTPPIPAPWKRSATASTPQESLPPYAPRAARRLWPRAECWQARHTPKFHNNRQI